MSVVVVTQYKPAAAAAATAVADADADGDGGTFNNYDHPLVAV